MKNGKHTANDLGRTEARSQEKAGGLDPKLTLVGACYHYVDARGYISLASSTTGRLCEEARQAAETALTYSANSARPYGQGPLSLTHA